MSDYLNTATILYVEDEPSVQEGYIKALSRYAKELYIASNGLEGLELFKKHDPDIVVTDIRMPVMDGMEMITKIKEISPEQIIIITSAHSDTDYFLDAINMQVDGYILKPVDKNILKHKIEHFSKQFVLEQEIEHKNRLLVQKEKLASMGEMITNIAHQWRQPLSVISTSASGMLLEREMNILSDEKFEKYLNLIIDNTMNLSKTIDEFKKFVEVDRDVVHFNISSVIKSSFLLEAQGIENLNIDVVFDMDETLLVNNYKNLFIQSLLNIINNAIDVLEKLENEKRFIFITLKKAQDNTIEIFIKDNGGGISEKIQKHIFEAYATTKHQYVGTGLGLYSTYNILVNDMKCAIEAYNETYTYESKEYTGAVFHITLRDHG